MSASVVGGGDVAPVLTAAEHDLDAVAPAVERGIVRDGLLARGRREDAGGEAVIGEASAEAGAVAFGHLRSRRRDRRSAHRWAAGGRDQLPAAVVAPLPFSQQEDQWPPLFPPAGPDGLGHGRRAASRATRLWCGPSQHRGPFVLRLAAGRCAYAWMARRMSRDGSPSSAATAAKRCSNTPMRLERTKRLCSVSRGPEPNRASSEPQPGLENEDDAAPPTAVSQPRLAVGAREERA